jgi:hypothetical protein
MQHMWLPEGQSCMQPRSCHANLRRSSLQKTCKMYQVVCLPS